MFLAVKSDVYVITVSNEKYSKSEPKELPQPIKIQINIVKKRQRRNEQ